MVIPVTATEVSIFPLWLRRMLIQFLYVLPVTLGALSEGIGGTWTSSAFPKLTSGEGPFKIDSDQASWVATLPMIGTLCAIPANVYVIDRLGRKLSLQIAFAVQFLSWVLVTLATSVEVLYTGMFIRGVSGCLVFSIAPLYIGEVAEPRIRGLLATLFMVMYNIGNLMANCIGPYTVYSVTSIVGLTVSGLAIAMYTWSPESPYFYLLKHKEEEAHRSLTKFRAGTDVSEELKEISAAVERQTQEKGNLLHLFTIRSNLKATIIVCGADVFQELTGIDSFLSYLQPVFDNSGGLMSGAASGIVFAAVKVIASLVSFAIIDYVGRKPILLFSSSVTAVILAAFGGYFYAKDVVGADVTSFSWFPTVMIIIYSITYSVGFNPIPFVLGSELFSASIKSWGTISTQVAYGVSAFLSVKMFSISTDSVGVYLPFWIYAGCTAASVFFFWYVVNETKGKSLESIQLEMKSKKEQN